jgi:hypothetical protein
MTKKAMTHNTRSSQKKRTTDEHNDDAANLEVNNPDEQKKSPTKRSKDDSSPGVNIETESRSSAVNGLTPKDEEFVSDSRKSAIAQVTRFLTPETSETAKGRVWMVVNGKYLSYSDNLHAITEVGANWIEALIRSDGTANTDNIFLTACDSPAAAMELARLQGGELFVRITPGETKREQTSEEAAIAVNAATCDALVESANEAFGTPIRLVPPGEQRIDTGSQSIVMERLTSAFHWLVEHHKEYHFYRDDDGF